MKWRETEKSRYRYLAILIAIMLVGGLYLPEASASPDNWGVDGEHGELAVHGSLLEGACRLDMSSAWQIVEMGNFSTASLVHPGDEGMPIIFKVILRDCIHMQGDRIDPRTNHHTWDPELPVISISFDTPSRHRGTELIDVPGMQGVGLRISDVRHDDMKLGFSGEPHFANAGDNELQFAVTPVRTAEPLITGPFQAFVDFHLKYD
ncbi:MAG: type 1 fimbrial protein [Hafnia sp.]